MRKRASTERASPLVTFLPAQDFAGYPFGQKVEFRVGVESIPVPSDFAQLMREKGHVAPSPVTVQD